MVMDKMVFPEEEHYTQGEIHKACDMNGKNGFAFVLFIINSFSSNKIHHWKPL